MPHSISPETTPAEDDSQTISQATIKREVDTQDVAMEDAPAPTEVKSTKADLEDLFDDDSDQEFASSAPVKEEDASQPKAL
jgi:DNA primase small subunit